MTLDLELLVQVLRGICIAIYVPMLPIIWGLLWLEYQHPALYHKLPNWLK